MLRKYCYWSLQYETKIIIYNIDFNHNVLLLLIIIGIIVYSYTINVYQNTQIGSSRDHHY